jgi:hypothetical protein
MRRDLGVWLDGVSALAAGAAAIFWFESATGELPPLVSYWGSAPSSDPLYQALVFSATMNRWAAIFAGAAASLQFLKGISSAWRP